jgi:hypothetical protein
LLEMSGNATYREVTSTRITFLLNVEVVDDQPGIHCDVR